MNNSPFATHDQKYSFKFGSTRFGVDCHICGEEGHWKNECPEIHTANSMRSCGACGGLGCRRGVMCKVCKGSSFENYVGRKSFYDVRTPLCCTVCDGGRHPLPGIPNCDRCRGTGTMYSVIRRICQGCVDNAPNQLAHDCLFVSVDLNSDSESDSEFDYETDVYDWDPETMDGDHVGQHEEPDITVLCVSYGRPCPRLVARVVVV